MLPENLPPCPRCLLKNWTAGDTYSGIGSVEYFHCSSCRALATFLNYGGAGVFLITKRSKVSRFTGVEVDYINGPLITALRFWSMRAEQAREVIRNLYRDKACDAVGIPRGSTMNNVPEASRDRFREVYEGVERDKLYLTPAGLGDPVRPPRMPSSLMAGLFFPGTHLFAGWRDSSETEELVVPLDPIRIKYDEYWEEIFEALRPVSGEIEKVEITNRYRGSKHEPWYVFMVGNGQFTVGSMDRFASIEVNFSTKVDISKIRGFADRDKVTLEVFRESEKGTNVLIHASGKYRTVEYLTVLTGLALKKSSL